MHPKWDVIIYNEDDAVRIIGDHLPNMLPIYKSYSHVVQRADIFRIILVYLFGGFYLDMDMYCLKPLDDLCNASMAIIAEEKTISNAEKNKLGLKQRLR
ncbi:MAG: glycoside transferase family 32, partial [Pedobacter sp.]